MERPHNVTLETLRRRDTALREALTKYHAGEPLTPREWNLVAYSEAGTAASCHCTPRPRWTEEDYRIFAEEDELDPERAQRLKTFLQTE